MSDLRKLFAAIEGRTKGPWSFERIRDNQTVFERCDIFSHAGSLEVAQDVLRHNAAFIAIMGIVADELAAVLRAVVAQDQDQLANAKYNIHFAQKVHEALATLAAKLGGGTVND